MAFLTSHFPTYPSCGMTLCCSHRYAGESEVEIITMIKATIEKLEDNFDDLVSHAREDMTTNKVDIQHLRHSITCLPHELKSEHKQFVEGVIADLSKAESIEGVFLITNQYWDFLNYSLLQRIIKRHASDKIKKEMEGYIQKIVAFRRKTSLRGFSKAYKRKPKRSDSKFRELVSEHNVDWSTATLEDVEQFRNDICSELSLVDF